MHNVNRLNTGSSRVGLPADEALQRRNIYNRQSGGDNIASLLHVRAGNPRHSEKTSFERICSNSTDRSFFSFLRALIILLLMRDFTSDLTTFSACGCCACSPISCQGGNRFAIQINVWMIRPAIANSPQSATSTRIGICAQQRPSISLISTDPRLLRLFVQTYKLSFTLRRTDGMHRAQKSTT